MSYGSMFLKESYNLMEDYTNQLEDLCDTIISDIVDTVNLLFDDVDVDDVKYTYNGNIDSEYTLRVACTIGRSNNLTKSYDSLSIDEDNTLIKTLEEKLILPNTPDGFDVDISIRYIDDEFNVLIEQWQY